MNDDTLKAYLAAYKQAADAAVPNPNFPVGGKITAKDIPYRTPGRGLTSYDTYSTKGTPLMNGGFLWVHDQRAPTAPQGGVTPINSPWTNKFMSNLGATKNNAVSMPNGAAAYSVPFKNVRRAFYGNSPAQIAREQEDTRRAMANRWADLYSVANHKQANRLDRLRAQGYIPPILSPNQKVITWSDFIHPDEKINISAFDDPYGRAYQANPFPVAPNRTWDVTSPVISLPLKDDPQKNQQAARHELAHAATLLNDHDSSIVSGIPGGDEGSEAFAEGKPGSYELNPQELYRMIFMQKALAGSRGDAPFRDVNEWVDWYNKVIRETDTSGRGLGIPSEPGRGTKGSIRLGDAASDSLADTMVHVLRQSKSWNPFTRRKAKKQLNQLLQRIQHAIDTSSVEQPKEGTYV